MQVVCARISELKSVVGSEGREITVTISTGAVVVQSASGGTVETILAHADLLLYRVKAAGRRGFQAEALTNDSNAAV